MNIPSVFWLVPVASIVALSMADFWTRFLVRVDLAGNIVCSPKAHFFVIVLNDYSHHDSPSNNIARKRCFCDPMRSEAHPMRGVWLQESLCCGFDSVFCRFHVGRSHIGRGSIRRVFR